MLDIKVLASGSRGNCYHITDGSTPLLLECGISIKEIRKGINFNLSEVAGVLVSHEHKDHSKAMADMLKVGIDIYASAGTIDAMKIGGHKVNIVRAKEQFSMGTWTILPFETHHDAAEPLGFLMTNTAGDKLLFATDTYYVRYKFVGITHLMIECNYANDILQSNVDEGIIPVSLRNRIIRAHFSLDNVKEFLKANDLSSIQEIWLLHLSDNNSDAERFKKEIQELTGKMVYVA